MRAQRSLSRRPPGRRSGRRGETGRGPNDVGVRPPVSGDRRQAARQLGLELQAGGTLDLGIAEQPAHVASARWKADGDHAIAGSIESASSSGRLIRSVPGAAIAVPTEDVASHRRPLVIASAVGRDERRTTCAVSRSDGSSPCGSIFRTPVSSATQTPRPSTARAAPFAFSPPGTSSTCSTATIARLSASSFHSVPL